MDSRERVAITLAHETPDRIPVNFRAVDAVTRRLMQLKDMDYERLLRHLQVDFREITPPYVGETLPVLPDGVVIDYWGVGRTIVQHADGGRDMMVTYHPLKDANTVADVRNHRWPKVEWFDFDAVPELCRQHKGYALSTHGIHAEGYHGVFHLLTYLFGMEKGIMYLASRPDLVNAAVEEITSFFLAYYEKFFRAANGEIDLLFYKDDFGSQNSQLISGRMFKDIFFTPLRKLTELAGSHDVKFVLHSCGAVFKLIPDFIEAGVSVLDPIQVTAKGMDIVKLKEEFGDRLVFHGAIDTQYLMPRGSADDVRAAAKRTIEVLGKGGGYFFSPAHRFQADTPTENILAAYETVHKYGRYAGPTSRDASVRAVEMQPAGA